MADDVDQPDAAADDAEAATGDDATAERPAGGAASEPARPRVTRRQVTSKRVTPKGGGPVAPTGPKRSGDRDVPAESARYTPPGRGATYEKGPSPWWVPALMFGLLIVGALIIMTNYMGLFGDAANIRLVIGLVFILAGIVTATQYR